jgi:hypothetical protein
MPLIITQTELTCRRFDYIYSCISLHHPELQLFDNHNKNGKVNKKLVVQFAKDINYARHHLIG